MIHFRLVFVISFFENNYLSVYQILCWFVGPLESQTCNAAIYCVGKHSSEIINREYIYILVI